MPVSDSNALIFPDETEAERQRRLDNEDRAIAEAIADCDAGLTVSSETVKAWIDSLATDHPLPLPRARRRPG